jgi:hypothetical protein
MTEASSDYRPTDDLETTLRKLEARVAQNYDRRREDDLTDALIAVLELIDAIEPGKPALIDCSKIPAQTGVSEAALISAMANRLTKFTFVSAENGPLGFQVIRKKKE